MVRVRMRRLCEDLPAIDETPSRTGHSQPNDHFPSRQHPSTRGRKVAAPRWCRKLLHERPHSTFPRSPHPIRTRLSKSARQAGIRPGFGNGGPRRSSRSACHQIKFGYVAGVALRNAHEPSYKAPLAKSATSGEVSAPAKFTTGRSPLRRRGALWGGLRGGPSLAPSPRACSGRHPYRRPGIFRGPAARHWRSWR